MLAELLFNKNIYKIIKINDHSIVTSKSRFVPIKNLSGSSAFSDASSIHLGTFSNDPSSVRSNATITTEKEKKKKRKLQKTHHCIKVSSKLTTSN